MSARAIIAVAATLGLLATASTAQHASSAQNVRGTIAVYEGCLAYNADKGTNALSCRYRGLRLSPDLLPSTLFGYLLPNNAPGARPVFVGCVDPAYNEHGTVSGCTTYGLRATADSWGFSSVAGYVAPDGPPGTRPIYSGCLEVQQTADGQFFCAVSGLRPNPDARGWSFVAGHVTAPR